MPIIYIDRIELRLIQCTARYEVLVTKDENEEDYRKIFKEGKELSGFTPTFIEYALPGDTTLVKVIMEDENFEGMEVVSFSDEQLIDHIAEEMAVQHFEEPNYTREMFINTKRFKEKKDVLKEKIRSIVKGYYGNG